MNYEPKVYIFVVSGVKKKSVRLNIYVIYMLLVRWMFLINN